jgi:hypothetical protein
LLEAVVNVVTEPSTCDYYIMDLDRDFLPPEWRALVGDREGDARSFNRRHLEVVTLLELAEAIKSGTCARGSCAQRSSLTGKSV